MNQHDDFDRSLARWFEAEARPATTADVLDRALHATSRRRPRPRLFAGLGSHWVGDSVSPTSGVGTLGRTGLRTSMALLLLLLTLVLVAGAILVGARLLQPAPDIGHLGHLAYAMEDGLYVADWDGRNPRRIVSRSQLPGPEGCREFFGGPTWSPDGRHLAVRTRWDDRCEGFILITDAKGSSLATIPASGWMIAWSPDSSRIVTWVALWETIGIYRIDGERQVLLPAPRELMGSGDHDVYWTPDGAAALVPYGVVVPLDGTPPYVDRWLRYSIRSRVSRDGTMIADGDGTGIVVAATDGSSRRVLGSIGLSKVLDVLWSPTGDRIAFVSGSGPGIVDVATGATTGLSMPTGEYRLIKFSPEGDRILLSAFHRADGRSSLWSVQADGSGAREVLDRIGDGDWQWLPPGSAPGSTSPGPTPTPAPSDDLGIFAPVAGRIVYGDEDGIWGVDPAATIVQLTSEAGTPLGWSSDGTQLLIMRQSPGERVGAMTAWHLFVLHADGSETQVTERPMANLGATISPDGSRVVFAGGTETPEGECCTRFALYAVDADGGAAEMLLEARNGIVEEPTFSPDGTRIAYADGAGDHSHSVWLIDADGSDARQIVSNEWTAAAGHVDGLAWSPDDDRIALGLGGATYTFATDGSGFTRVITSGERPYWSPDGSQLAYTISCLQDDGCGLAIADADGSNARELRFATSGPWHPAPR